MKDWNDPYAEGDHEYDHSAGSVYAGLMQGAKYFGILVLVLITGGVTLILSLLPDR